MPTQPRAVPLLMSVFETAKDGYVLFDADERLAYCNPQAAVLLAGLGDLLVPGCRLADVLAGAAGRQLLREVGGGGAAWLDGQLAVSRAGGCATVTLAGGQRQWWAWSGGDAGRLLTITQRLPCHGPAGMVGRVADGSRALADWAWETDNSLRLTGISDSFAEIGRSVPQALLGKRHVTLARRFVADAANWRRHVADLRACRAFRDFRVRFLDDSGQIRHFRISGAPAFDGAGSFLGYRGTGADVTAEIEGQAAWCQTQARLIEAVERVSDDFLLFDEHDRLQLRNHRPDSSPALQPGMGIAEVLLAVAVEAGVSDVAQIADWVAERLRWYENGGSFEERFADGRCLLVKIRRLPDGATVVTRTDVTEIKRREQQQCDSEARFRAIFERAAVGIAVIRPGGRIDQANPALAAMFDYDAGDLVGRPYVELTHPDDRDEDVRQARRLVAGEIHHYQIETRYIRRDGEVFWGRLTVSLVRGDGPERFAVAMIEDIDKRKRAEDELAMFRAVVEACNEAVALVGANGRAFYVNPAFESLVHRPAHDIVGADYRELYSPASRPVVEHEVAPALQRGGSWEGVLEANDTDGKIFPMWLRAGSVRGQGRRPRFFFAFMRDHTREKSVQDEVFRAKEAAEQANLAKTRFLAAASHDLRQPLQALGMFVAVLSGRDHTPQDEALIGKIRDSVNAVEGLLSSLLDVSKLEAGLVVPAEETFSVGPMMHRLAAEFEPLTAEAGLSLRFVPARAVVCSDAALLERILRNLLNNAVRYTNTGRILFGCRRYGPMLRFEVWDTGPGIPAGQLKQIFREFHQLDTPGRERNQGLGLGLAIVERLATLLNHRIDVRSVLHKGSMFAVEVPVADTALPIRQPRQLSLGIARIGCAVMVIDDEPDVREGISLLLESWGHRVVTAGNCDDALRALPRLGKAPDLILADYRLQNGSTGGQAIARIRLRLKVPVPAIILTGDTAPERLRQATANGHALLHKPVHPDSLRAAIDEVLARAPQKDGKGARA